MFVKLFVGDKEQEFKSMYFSGGEPHVELSAEAMKALHDVDKPVLIDARVGSMHDFGTMLALTNAVQQYRDDVSLLIPYFPGARQDRQQEGFAFTAKMYADIINAQKYETVYILDPHSQVTVGLLDRPEVIPTTEIVKQFMEGKDIVGLICPDAGARDRTNKLARELGMDHVVYASKQRDSKTGALTGFKLDPLPVHGQYLVVDDICDGGGTFLGLAKEYYNDPKASSLHLWVTHGIFSKGMKELSTLYSTIGCTDSFPSHGMDGTIELFKLKGVPQ
jgi:ribose-phosphate pyrophosphokinase